MVSRRLNSPLGKGRGAKRVEWKLQGLSILSVAARLSDGLAAVSGKQFRRCRSTKR